jgi:hypothetical protein
MALDATGQGGSSAPFQRVETVHPLVIHHPALAAKVDVKLAIACAHTHAGQLLQTPT